MSTDKNRSKKGVRILLRYFYKDRKCRACALHFNAEMNTVGGVHLLFQRLLPSLPSRYSSVCKSSTVYRYEYLRGNLEGKCIKMGFITTIKFFYLTPN